MNISKPIQPDDAIKPNMSTEAVPVKVINKLPAICLSSDASVRHVMTSVFHTEGWQDDGVINADQIQAVELLSQSTTPPLVFIDLDNLSDPVAYLEQLSSVCDPGSDVVVFGVDNRIQTYHDIKSLGVLDYIPKPLAADQIEVFLESRKQSQSTGTDNADTEKATSIAVIGARGGVGATALSLEIARSALPMEFTKNLKAIKKGRIDKTSADGKTLNSRGTRHTVVLDLDVNFGCTGLYTDIQPTHALVDVLSDPERLDDLFLERSVIMLDNGLHLLAAEDDPAHQTIVEQEAISLMFNKLLHGYQTIVMDIPRHLVSELAEIAVELDHIVLVMEPNIASLRDAIRLSNWFKTFDKGPKIHVVLNKVGRSKKAELDIKDVSKTLGQEPVAALPYIPDAFVAASEKGKTLQETKAPKPVMLEITKLRNSIFGVPDSNEKISIFAKLVGKKS